MLCAYVLSLVERLDSGQHKQRHRLTVAQSPSRKHGNQAGMWYVPDARAGTPVLVPCSRLQAVLVAGCEIEAVQAIMRT